MLDAILEIFERDERRDNGRRRGLRGFFDRFNEDDDDERARRTHPARRSDEYDDEDGWDDDRRSRW